jgi:hypothetical protein
MEEEPSFFGYQFICYDGKKVSQSKESMKIIFERTEILYYLIHGHPQFKKEELNIKDGFILVNISFYYINSEQLTKWFRALSGYGSVSDMINEWGFHLGGSNYLESQLEKLKHITPTKKNINSPINDDNNHYSWKHDIITTAVQEHISATIQERENDGYTLITTKTLGQNSAYPFQLTFRKPI